MRPVAPATTGRAFACGAGREPVRPTFLVVDPAHFEIAYTINPWMRPDRWMERPEAMREAARAAFEALSEALVAAGARLETIPGVHGAPDLVFPANAAVVLDGRAILAKFGHAERRVEEPVFRQAFAALRDRGLLHEVAELADGDVQEGAGDCIWDATRDLFWAGHGQRSNRAGLERVAAFFERTTVPLELATPRFYHLDTCFCPLSGGEILYYPPAFTPAALSAIRGLVPGDALIEATDEDAARFCVNAVCLDRTIVMASASVRLRAVLAERGYRLADVDLSPFILAGGGAFCMTLRLDRVSATTCPSPRATLQ